MPNAAAAKTRGSRSERLEARVTPEQKGLIEQAAAQGLSDRVLTSEGLRAEPRNRSIMTGSTTLPTGTIRPRRRPASTWSSSTARSRSTRSARRRRAPARCCATPAPEAMVIGVTDRGAVRRLSPDQGETGQTGHMWRGSLFRRPMPGVRSMWQFGHSKPDKPDTCGERLPIRCLVPGAHSKPSFARCASFGG